MTRGSFYSKAMVWRPHRAFPARVHNRCGDQSGVDSYATVVAEHPLGFGSAGVKAGRDAGCHIPLRDSPTMQGVPQLAMRAIEARSRLPRVKPQSCTARWRPWALDDARSAWGRQSSRRLDVER
jgi:hypothetical protein